VDSNLWGTNKIYFQLYKNITTCAVAPSACSAGPARWTVGGTSVRKGLGKINLSFFIIYYIMVIGKMYLIFIPIKIMM